MYLTKILKLYKFFHLFAIFRTKCNGLAAIGNDFILLDDNARFCRAVLVEDYLESQGLERMEWPAQSPDLNTIEQV